MSDNYATAPIHQHTTNWQPWTHYCGRQLEIAWRYNGVQEYPMWRVGPGWGVAICPHCCGRLRADQEQPRPHRPLITWGICPVCGDCGESDVKIEHFILHTGEAMHRFTCPDCGVHSAIVLYDCPHCQSI